MGPQCTRADRNLLYLYSTFIGGVIAAYFIVPSVAQPFLYSFVGVATVVALAYGGRKGRPNGAAWRWIAGGIGLWVLGDAMWTGADVLGKTLPYPSFADVLYIVGYPMLIFGVWRVFESPGKSLTRMLDTGIIALGIASFVWVFLVEGVIEQAGAAPLQMLTAADGPTMDLVLLAVLVRSAFIRQARSVATDLVGLAIGLILLTDLVYAKQSLSGSYVGGGWLDAGWLVGYFTLGASALIGHRVKRRVARAARRNPVLPIRLIFTLLGALLVPAVFIGELILGRSVDYRAAIPTTVLMFALVTVRVVGLMRQHISQVDTLVLREAELAESDEKFRSIFDNVSEGLYQSTLDGRLLTINHAGARILGFDSPEEALLLEATSDIYVDPAHRVEMVKALEQYGRIKGYEVEVRRTDGEAFWMQLESRLITSPTDSRKIILGIFTDVTEKRRLESQLRQAEKMEAVGQLAGGIAHDFNNILSVILNNGRFVLKDVEEGSQSHTDVQEMVDAADRAATLTSQLLAFSTEDSFAPKVLDVNEVISDMKVLLGDTFKKNVRFEMLLDPELSNIDMDRFQLEQLIMSMAQNSAQAMVDGGTFTISTANIDPAVQGGSSDNKERVQLSITDTGIGMEKEVSDRAFEPFFTTRQIGEGSGLGLASVYGIIERSGGSVSISSEPGIGTTFEMSFAAAL
ncbi:MAG: two-component system, cell cycle sensor histidine kinase and response regulator CckA [Actinomycetota bacterium]|nr:two-component system, cell cycle sensor histidine kinase and response regulator CckA [Actinomycetota bacterium]